MKKFFFLSMIVFFISDCTGNHSKEENKDAAQTEEQKKPGNDKRKDLSGCYLRVIGRDTLVAVIDQHGDQITGKLNFDNYEKDGSKGKIEGRVENDIIKLFYDFQSEGMHSVAQHYFKVVENGLIQGIGEVKVSGDTALYASEREVSYPLSNTLIRKDCSQVDNKYK